MKAILMSIKPRFVAKILNGEKTIEVRKRFTASYRGRVYIYCTKDKKKHLYPVALLDKHNKVFKRGYKEDDIDNRANYLNGKVVARFYCDNVEEILVKPNGNYYTNTLSNNKLLTQSCLSQKEIFEYTKCHISKISGCWISDYTIHISDLEIFDKPKELCGFRKYYRSKGYPQNQSWYLTKTPQSRCYIEV